MMTVSKGDPEENIDIMIMIFHFKLFTPIMGFNPFFLHKSYNNVAVTCLYW